LYTLVWKTVLFLHNVHIALPLITRFTHHSDDCARASHWRARMRQNRRLAFVGLRHCYIFGFQSQDSVYKLVCVYVRMFIYIFIYARQVFRPPPSRNSWRDRDPLDGNRRVVFNYREIYRREVNLGLVWYCKCTAAMYMPPFCTCQKTYRPV